MALNTHVDQHMKSEFGSAAFTVSGAQATMPSANVNHDQLQRLMDVARVTGHRVSLASGVLTIKPSV